MEFAVDIPQVCSHSVFREVEGFSNLSGRVKLGKSFQHATFCLGQYVGLDESRLAWQVIWRSDLYPMQRL